MFRYSVEGGENVMQQLKAVMIISGFAPDMSCAINEMCEIAEGYGAKIDIVRETDTEEN